VALEAQLAAGQPEEIFILSTVRLMTGPATDEGDHAMRNLVLRSSLILVADSALSSSRLADQLFLRRCVRVVAIGAARHLQRRVGHGRGFRRLTDVVVTGETERAVEDRSVDVCGEQVLVTGAVR
jgi:hypothetical protein